MLSRKGQCKWTCRLTPFRIAFILLHHLVIFVNNFIYFSFIWAKKKNPCIAQVSYFSVLRCKIYTHERKEDCATGEEGGGLPHQATWLALLALLINYSLILAYRPITRLVSTNSATMLMPSDAIYSWHHHALSNKNILKSWLLSTVQILDLCTIWFRWQNLHIPQKRTFSWGKIL